MADLGSNVTRVSAHPAVRVAPQLPLSAGVKRANDNTGYVDVEPLFTLVSAPVPTAGLFAFECYTPGTFLRYRPVDAGQTVTYSVKVRKNADYVDSAAPSMSRPPVSILPYVELTMPDGQKARATKGAGVDSYETLTVGPLVMARSGVLEVRLVQEGTLGDNLLFLPEVRRVNFPGPKCWWADESVSVT